MDAIIVSVDFRDDDWRIIVDAKFSDGSYKEVFSYYPKELHFQEDELIGLTEEEAVRLWRKKDRNYQLSNMDY